MPVARARTVWSPRALLVLGRVSNLPTVWSNCLAGWLLGGGGTGLRLLGVCAAATLLYIGGMYLNDAFDVDFDSQRRRERPVPSGQVSLSLVWRLGWLWLALGIGACAWLGKTGLLVGGVLAASIVLYNAIHKRTPLATVVMGNCRFLLYLLGAGAAVDGITGLAIWSGLALGAYITGLSHLARKESILGPVHGWPVILLGTPIVVALLANGPDYRERAFHLSLLLVIWIIPSLRFVFRKDAPKIGFAVANLLAGIVLVDLIAIVADPPAAALAFAALFLLALGLQRFVPAT